MNDTNPNLDNKTYTNDEIRNFNNFKDLCLSIGFCWNDQHGLNTFLYRVERINRTTTTHETLEIHNPIIKGNIDLQDELMKKFISINKTNIIKKFEKKTLKMDKDKERGGSSTIQLGAWPRDHSYSLSNINNALTNNIFSQNFINKMRNLNIQYR